MNSMKIQSEFDGLWLEAAVSVPEGSPKGVILFSHGMAEHKERYFNFMNFLSAHGYVCAIHDHRGHGGSVRSEEDYGYFYTENEQAVIDDLQTVKKAVTADYPALPVFLFSHSMGTLVARGYLKKYDSEIEKLVLCGPPTYNAAANIAVTLARLSKPFHKEKEPNEMLHKIAFNGYNTGNELPNGWLSVNPDNVLAYNADPQCGFLFTTNGFMNLFKLQRGAFTKKGWKMAKPSLPIFVIAGEKDPVIGSPEKFDALIAFLKERGYSDVQSRLYDGLRHEILNEANRAEIYEDVLRFFEK